MSGLKVKCPNCKQICFETTDKYDPDVSARGDMLKSLMPYHLDFLLSATTLAPYLTCPKCGDGQLAPSGRLTIVYPSMKDACINAKDGDVVEVPPTDNREDLAPSAVLPSGLGAEDSMVSENRYYDVKKPKVGKPVFVCDVCGKELKTAGALALHKRSHTKGEVTNG